MDETSIARFVSGFRISGLRTPSDGTRRTYARVLRLYLAWVRAHGDISNNDGAVAAHDGFVRHIAETRSLAYARVAYAAVRRYHEFLGVKSAEVEIANTPPSPKFVSTDEINRVIAECRTPVERAVILTAFETGVRAKELLGMTWADVDLDGGYISVVRKGRREPQQVPLYEGARDALRELREYQTARSSHAPSVPFGMPYLRLYDLVRRVGARAGIKLSPHMLRHACGAYLRRNGVAIDRIAEQLGHTDPKVTWSYYAHLAPHELKDELAGIFERRTH